MKPSASGTARAGATSTSPTPVAASAATSSPLRTAWAAPSSTIAAVSVASTWSATAWVTLTPSARASPRACVVTAAVSWRRCRVRARSSSPSRLACASRSAVPTCSTCSTCGGVAAYEQVDDPRGQRRLLQRLEPGGQLLVGLVLLDQRVAGRGEVRQRQRVEPVGELEERVGHLGDPTSAYSSSVGCGTHGHSCSTPVGAPAEVLVEAPGPVVGVEDPQPSGAVGHGPGDPGPRQPGPPGVRVHGQVAQVDVVVRREGQQAGVPVHDLDHHLGVLQHQRPAAEHGVVGEREAVGGEHVGEADEVGGALEVAERAGVVGAGGAPVTARRLTHRRRGRARSPTG